MKIIIEHKLQEDNALCCAKKILDELKEEHHDKISNLVQMWTDNESQFSFRLKGISITGTIRVNAGNIEIFGSLPFAARIFQGVIEDAIKKNAQKMLDNCK